MADEEKTTTDAAAPTDAASTNGAAQPQQMPQMQVLGQFIRDLSFENIAVQKGQAMEGQPDINVQVGLEAKKRTTEGQYEVAVKLNVTAKVKGGTDPIFALELDYAGVFQIANVPDNQMHPYLMIECPRMLFPFLRRIVSDVSRDGGFPPLNLENIDFVALYRNELTRRVQAEAAQVKPS
ncbi:MAG: protein-export chaperone SecB [Jannaschia helgolandensis]|jgi:preprotein translocase subunit SecB|uniref:Protein-export protein SecB n=1 Tax=Jannaschia helgolandensis TaxID=188906 RepID=A0A1H7GYC3_9RHOB|nr:protein-export chaperone SecB [Jannaschia helgolandensis]SEK41650.1 protein translocase subunit secB [Jannaschia helgolandensis]|tara:strand:- start:2011 stop:2550 length:540 start_codon:yes stop_codon:yes gene_type:complete